MRSPLEGEGLPPFLFRRGLIGIFYIFLKLSSQTSLASLHLFFEAEQLVYDGRPHQAAKIKNEFIEICRSTSHKEDPEFSISCAIAEEEVRRKIFWFQIPLVEILIPKSEFPLNLVNHLEFDKKVLWEARLFLSPWSERIREGRGWLALESLIRLKPDFDLGRKWYQEASLRREFRVSPTYDQSLVHFEEILVHHKFGNVRPAYGIKPFVGYQTFIGFLGGVQAWDDRVSDEERSIYAEGRVSLQGDGMFLLSWWDAVLLRPHLIQLKVEGESKRTRFFPIATVFQKSLSLEFRTLVSILDDFRCSLGGHTEFLDAESVLLASENWKPLPSRLLIAPILGVQIKKYFRENRFNFEVEFDFRPYLQATSVLLYKLKNWVLIENSWFLMAQVQGSFLWGRDSRDLYPMVGTTLGYLPGTEVEKWRAPRTLGLSGEVAYEFSPWMRLGAFWTSWWLQRWWASGTQIYQGPGILLEIGRQPSNQARLEIGYLDRIWTMRFASSMSLL